MIPTSTVPGPAASAAVAIPPRMAFVPPATGMVYGASNTAKTTQLMRVAEWLWRTKRKRTRYIYADNGGVSHVQDIIDSGIVDLFPINDSIAAPPHVILRAIAKGAWKPLIPGRNGQVYLSPAKREKVTVTVGGGGDMTMEVATVPEDVGAYIVESTSSLGDLIKRFMTKTGQKVSQDVVAAYNVPSLVEGEKPEIFSSASMSHYGHIQDIVMQFINDMSSLAVPLVIFSAHESKGEDEITKTPIYGPALLGKAATSKMRKDVGFLLHMEQVAPQASVGAGPGVKAAEHPTGPKNEIRAYFEDHADSQMGSITWPTNSRFPAASIPKLYERWRNGYIPLSLDPDDPNGNLWGFLELREKCLEEQRKRLERMKG